MAYYKCGSIHPTQNSNVVVDTASGAIANFQTPLAMPLLKTQFDFKATQEAGTPTPDSPKDISGVSSFSLFRSKKNLFNINYLTASGIIIQSEEAIGTAQTFYDNFGTNTEGLKKLKFKPNTAYTLSLKAYTDGSYTTSGQGIYFRINYTDGTYVSLAINNNQQEYGEFARTTSASKTIDRIYIVYSSGYSNTWHLKDIQLEEGSTATDFEPYNGSTTLINLGGTYYGGYVSQDKDGHRQFDDLYSSLVNLADLSFNQTTNGGYTCFYADLPNGVIKSGGEQSFTGGCSTYAVTSNLSLPNDMSCVFYCSELYGGYTRILIRDDSASAMTGAQFTTYVTGQIYYEKHSPQTIDLPDGQPIKSFAGINNIFADTGDTSLQFRKIG